ncbi:MAG TPA: MATE family efflux transporter [Opitutaceae bacterium]|nr:MATE family efflux transporter [Opitutaceae bacterium]
MVSAPVPGPASPSAPAFPFWGEVRRALRGDHGADYTSLPLRRAVLLLAVPMVAEMMMESLFAVSDVFWVSRLGRDAIAVVGLNESVMTLIYAVAMGICFAATAMVARRIGERQPAAAARTAGQVLMLGLTLAAGLGAAGGALAPAVLRAMGADPGVVALGSSFSRVMLGGNVTVFLIFLLNAVFRGAGDAVIAMRTLWLANGLNIVLGPCFIFGWGPFPHLGLVGAAVATNTGRGIGVLYQLWHLRGRGGRIRVAWEDLRPDPGILGQVLRTSGSGIAQLLINMSSWVLLFRLLAQFGSQALAGYTIAIRLVMFALMPPWGLANAGATLVGQNLGAGKPERAEAAVRMATRLNVVFLGIIGACYVAGAHPLVAGFTADPAVRAEAVRALWIISLAFPVYAAGMCLGAAFNGAGDTWTPTRLNFFCFWLGQVPLAWALSGPARLGPTGVDIAVPVSFTALTGWTWLLFRRGRWKRQRI